MTNRQLQLYFLSNYAKLMLYHQLFEGSMDLARSICEFIIESISGTALVPQILEKFYSFEQESILRNGKGRIIADNFENLEEIRQNDPEIFQETSSQIFEMMFKQEIDVKNNGPDYLFGKGEYYQAKNFNTFQISCGENIISESVSKIATEGDPFITASVSLKNKSGKELYLKLIMPVVFHLVPYDIYFADVKDSSSAVEFDKYNGNCKMLTEESFASEWNYVVLYGNLSKKDGMTNLIFSIINSWMMVLKGDSLGEKRFRAKKDNAHPEEIKKLDDEYFNRMALSYKVAFRLARHLEEKGFKLF
jgi:hypothetical protein